jgi:sugar transferase (PEP-CTERM/EpsH1 system associated)
VNILILSHRVPFPPNKGEKIRTFHQIKYLKELGHELHLLAPLESNEELGFFKHLSQLFFESIIYDPLPNKLLRLAKGFLKGKALSVANFYNPIMQNKMDKLLAQQHFDAIICCASSMAEYVFESEILNTLDKEPMLIMDFMDVDSDKWGQYKQNSPFLKSWIYSREQRLLASYEARIAKRFDACYLIAQAEVDLFKKNIFQSENIHVLGNGMDCSAFHPASNKVSNSSPVFLFTGVMDYKPNVDAVVWFANSCWQDISDKYPGARFIIAGMTPNNEVLKLSDMQGIEVTGYVDDILPYYHSADIFVAPFRLARGVQNKILQAFSCSLPVVATPMGAEGIMCKQGEDILLALQPEDFLQQIDKLLDSPDLAKSLGENARDLTMKHYSWKGQLTPLINLLLNNSSFK